MQKLPFVMLDRAWRRVVLILRLQAVDCGRNIFYSEEIESEGVE